VRSKFANPAERGEPAVRELDREGGSGSLDLTDPAKRGLDRNCGSVDMPHSAMGGASDGMTGSDLQIPRCGRSWGGVLMAFFLKDSNCVYFICLYPSCLGIFC